jgi:methionyl-tRNA synthetase
METKPEIQYEDFAKLDIRMGTVIAAEEVPETDKLIKCTVDFGELGERTIVSGIKAWKKPENLVGKQLPYIVNLAPRMLKGIESQGMLLAGSPEVQGLVLLHPEFEVAPGTKLS